MEPPLSRHQPAALSLGPESIAGLPASLHENATPKRLLQSHYAGCVSLRRCCSRRETQGFALTQVPAFSLQKFCARGDSDQRVAIDEHSPLLPSNISRSGDGSRGRESRRKSIAGLDSWPAVVMKGQLMSLARPHHDGDGPAPQQAALDRVKASWAMILAVRVNHAVTGLMFKGGSSYVRPGGMTGQQGCLAATTEFDRPRLRVVETNESRLGDSGLP